jgi:hypothetical protein
VLFQLSYIPAERPSSIAVVLRSLSIPRLRAVGADWTIGRTFPKPPIRGPLGWRDAPVHFFVRQLRVHDLTVGY